MKDFFTILGAVLFVIGSLGYCLVGLVAYLLPRPTEAISPVPSPGGFRARCSCGALGPVCTSRVGAVDVVVWSERWHPARGCPACERSPPRRVAAWFRSHSLRSVIRLF